MIPILSSSPSVVSASRLAVHPRGHRLAASCRSRLFLIALIVIAIVRSDRTPPVARAFDLPSSSRRTSSGSLVRSPTTKSPESSKQSLDARGFHRDLASRQSLSLSGLRQSFRLATSALSSSAMSSLTSHQQREQWLASDLERQLETVEPRREGGREEEDSVVGSEMLNHREGVDGVVRGPARVLVYDTTLRDGTQGESISASVDDKLKIAKRLVHFGVDFVEAGWPGSNPKDAAFFERAKVELTAEERLRLVAFGSTRRKRAKAEEDPQVKALIESDAPTLCLVAKAHALQVEQVLRATLEENLAMIRDTVSHLVYKHRRRVMVDLEHFFDGYRHDPEYALRCCDVAVEAGASCLVLCDTNGGTMPWQIADACRVVASRYLSSHSVSKGATDGEANEQGLRRRVTLGIHAHNDCGMAVANSLVACQEGIGLVQGTINGIGERTGNADLTSIVPSLVLHCDSSLACHSSLPELTKLSRFVDEILNRTPNQAAPYVGSSAFAHKGGLHVAAMERSSFSYQHVEPEAVGNEKRVLVSELSGRHNILGMMEQVLGDSSASSGQAYTQRANAILNRVKKLEARGYTFEGAEASVRLMILHASRGYCPPFQVLDYSANVYDYSMDSASRVVVEDGGAFSESTSTARATVKVRTMRLASNEGDAGLDDDHLPYVDCLEVADGNGPVDALANALLRALQPSHPYLRNVELVDYKVRILDPESATRATTRVLIEFRDSETGESWTTVSVDANVISASLNALIDGFEYALVEHAESCMLCEDMFE